MKCLRLRRIAVAGAVAASTAGLVLASAMPSQAAAASPSRVAAARPAAAHMGSRQRVLVDCRGHALMRPRHFVIACADAGDYLTRMHWYSWSRAARARGAEWINSCVPNCASGRYYRYWVRVELWQARKRPHHHGEWYYSRMTIWYGHRVPSGYHHRRTIRLIPLA
ncbi:MAG: hypothetical protein ACLQDY_03275 [Streptosporangiaceae bacterium]